MILSTEMLKRYQHSDKTLPGYGYGYYRKPTGLELIQIPMIDLAEIYRLINHWYGQPLTQKQIEKRQGMRQ